MIDDPKVAGTESAEAEAPMEDEPWVVCSGCRNRHAPSAMVRHFGSLACASCWDVVFAEVAMEGVECTIAQGARPTPTGDPIAAGGIPEALAETCPRVRSRAKRGRGGWRKR